MTTNSSIKKELPQNWIFEFEIYNVLDRLYFGLIELMTRYFLLGYSHLNKY